MTGDKVNPPAGEIRLNGRFGFSANESIERQRRKTKKYL
jgi:hypothetical protein